METPEINEIEEVKEIEEILSGTNYACGVV